MAGNCRGGGFFVLVGRSTALAYIMRSTCNFAQDQLRVAPSVPSSAIRLVVITGGCLVPILQMRVMGGGFSSREDSMFITCGGVVLWR